MVMQRENVCQGQKLNYKICTHYEFGNVCAFVQLFHSTQKLRVYAPHTYSHMYALEPNFQRNMQILPYNLFIFLSRYLNNAYMSANHQI